MDSVWLTTAYFGPVHYFKLMAGNPVVRIEACEHYQKQSFRNRCQIVSANGPITLSIPILKGRSPGQLIRDVRIDHQGNWQKIHFKSIESAYRHSPYYEFHIDDLMEFWSVRWNFLFDYNLAITERVIRLLNLKCTLRLTESFGEPGCYGAGDYRYRIHPKLKEEGTDLISVPYHQVFSDRFGFVGGLSILDVLFNLNLSSF
ncbi:MAG: WbqC family protein [Bacteroidales bacterium]